jgi:hypothetical protein
MSTRGNNLAPPPRLVPLSLKLNVVFGGFLNQFGWLFFSFGMLFVMLFSSEVDFSDTTRFRGQLATVRGTVLAGGETGETINDEDVVGWEFEYQVEGQTFQGISYTTGWKYNEGDKVTVEFPADDPGCSRIVGSRKSKLPPWLPLLVGIFPAMGLLVLQYGLRHGLKACRLLAHGRLAHGRLVNKSRTNISVEDDPVYELAFAFQPEGYDREYRCTVRSHEPEELEDEPVEPLLYLPSDPNQAVMLDGIPGGVEFTRAGQFRAKKPLQSLLLILSPLAGLILLAFTVRNLVN